MAGYRGVFVYIGLLVGASIVLDMLARSLRKRHGRRRSVAPASGYRLRDDFMSRPETEFYGVLAHICRDWAALFVKVNLGDVLYAPQRLGTSQWAMWNRINRKHVDYLLCDCVSLRPLVAVELDDRSHQRMDRVARDRFVDAALAQAGLPVVHVPLCRDLNIDELEATLRSAASRAPVQAVATAMPAEAPRDARENAETEQMEATAPTLGAPTCPRCGGPMVRRVAHRGKRAGEEFWGCADYPRCSGTRPL